MNDPHALNLVLPVTMLLLLLAVLAIALYAIHRFLRRELRPGETALTGAAQVPFPALEQMVLQIKKQNEELERLHRELKQRDRDSLRLSQELLGHLPSGVLFFDRSGVVQEANPAARTALGFASPQGLRAAELFRDAVVREQSGERLGTVAALMQTAIEKTGAPLQRKELDYVTPQGQHRTLGITISPILRNTAKADDRGLDGLICLLTDLTTIRALEDELRQRQNLAALGEMAAGIAHEFKNALATISGYAQMLGRELAAGPSERAAAAPEATETGEELRGYAAKIIDQVAELTEMTSEFLTFARPLDARQEPLPLVEALEDAIRALKVQEFAGVQIERQGASPVVLGDRVLLNHVWINLVRNACESVAQSGRPGRVVIEVEERDEHARIRICDTGPGIAPDVADKIFIPFFTTKPAGTGLGLAVVFKIVAAHRGAVVLEDASPGHTTFAVTLPLAPAEGPPPVPAELGRGRGDDLGTCT